MERNNSSPRQSTKLGFFIDYYLSVTWEASFVHLSGEHLFLLPETKNKPKKKRAVCNRRHSPRTIKQVIRLDGPIS